MNTGTDWADGRRITEIRKERGLTITALADKIKVQRGSLNNIERGHRGASLDMLQKIAKGLDVDILDILKPDASLREVLTRSSGEGAA